MPKLENPQDHQDLEQQALPIKWKRKPYRKMNAFQKNLTTIDMYFTLKMVNSSIKAKYALYPSLSQKHYVFISEVMTTVMSSAWTDPQPEEDHRITSSAALKWRKNSKQPRPKYCLLLEAALLSCYILRLLHVSDCSFKFYAVCLKSLFHSDETNASTCFCIIL